MCTDFFSLSSFTLFSFAKSDVKSRAPRRLIERRTRCALQTATPTEAQGTCKRVLHFSVEAYEGGVLTKARMEGSSAAKVESRSAMLVAYGSP